MPSKGYSNITVRNEIREKLDELRQKIGIRDLSDLLVFLVDKYNEFTVIYSKLADLMTRLEDLKCLGEELFSRLERLRVKLGFTNVFDVIKFLLETYEAEEEYLRFRKEALEKLEKIDRTIKEIDEKLRRNNEWWHKYLVEREKKREIEETSA
jgi:RecG-like helicase